MVFMMSLLSGVQCEDFYLWLKQGWNTSPDKANVSVKAADLHHLKGFTCICCFLKKMKKENRTKLTE